MLPKIFRRKQKGPSWNQLMKDIREAKKDPEFMKEVRKFIKITTS